jgi:hypothetical protein
LPNDVKPAGQVVPLAVAKTKPDGVSFTVAAGLVPKPEAVAV